ncbi:hypothetical protein AR438_10995 [Chryseobacterium aquaticum]|uniref:DUF4209 domain-containing protein n=1 Tax=Chryseobacterium aquaticum TaxID=452084 RepID=A0A0Q3KPM0_9FLAO|nr:DUF4209 domain-containing protein [Chryseobacterium aquaticum]KQK26100.1 hypothetical protein AR438_10995 [Chryseobacterium aquaticum]
MSKQYKISEKVYSQNLRAEIHRAARSNPDDLELQNLLELLRSDLSEQSLIKLSKNENFIIPSSETENIEVLARINDLKFILGGKDKKSNIKNAVTLYQKLFDETDELHFFTRSIDLVRKAKSLFLPEMSGFEKKILDIFGKLTSSYYRLLLINSSDFLIMEVSKQLLINKSLDFLEKDFNENEYNSARKYIQILNKLGHYDNNALKVQNAISMEKEGDSTASKKEPGVYYPTILQAYTDALRELKSTPGNDDLKDRLNSKIKIEQKEYYNILKNSGINIESKFDIPKMLEELEVVDFNTGFSTLFQIPIIEQKMIDSSFEQKNKTFFGQFFKDYIHITNKGTVSGIADEEKYNNNLTRNYHRMITIGLINEIKSIMDSYEKISRKVVSEFILSANSPFIPKGREHFFVEGIYSGFQNNYISSSHLLIPQIENSLKNIVEMNGRNTVRLADDIQNDNTLGAILKSDNPDKMLNGLCNEDLILELQSFLLDGNSVNFRNRICHGLIEPAEIDFYGIYLWWLTLRMVFHTKELFSIPE